MLGANWGIKGKKCAQVNGGVCAPRGHARHSLLDASLPRIRMALRRPSTQIDRLVLATHESNGRLVSPTHILLAARHRNHRDAKGRPRRLPQAPRHSDQRISFQCHAGRPPSSAHVNILRTGVAHTASGTEARRLGGGDMEGHGGGHGRGGGCREKSKGQISSPKELRRT